MPTKPPPEGPHRGSTSRDATGEGTDRRGEHGTDGGGGRGNAADTVGTVGAPGTPPARPPGPTTAVGTPPPGAKPAAKPSSQSGEFLRPMTARRGVDLGGPASRPTPNPGATGARKTLGDPTADGEAHTLALGELRADPGDATAERTIGTVARAAAGIPSLSGEPAPPGPGGNRPSQPTFGVAPTAIATAHDETILPSWDVHGLASLPDPGYQLGEVIGRGGMGEVVAAQDHRIGREVAIKRIRATDPSPDAVTRFLREARIQARLDHPAIVPVYELGTDAEGRPYFTMKRLAGETLGKKLQGGGPVQPLLRAFVDVCLAIQLAHSRGVVHRDLKPSNIMLGDYGEVYVLDWGVARVLTDRRRTTQPSMAAQIDDSTTAGSILGTPGYMAPEQVRGFEADAKADVYALGAILFEILTGEALHPRGEAALSSTLTQPQEAPTRRVAEKRQVAPELDAVCFDALSEEPNARPSAREIADRVQAYLDGDRDVERRRSLAADQVAAARKALVEDPREGRATAMRRAGRAIVLDPESTEAAELVSSLLLQAPPPDKMPPDLERYLVDEDKALSRSRSRQGMWTYLTLFLFWLVIPFMDVKSWTALLAFYGLIGLGALLAWRNSQRGDVSVPVTLVITGVVPVVFTRISGPFILTPIVICAALMQLAAIRYIAERLWITLAWCVVVVITPFILEWTGVIDPTFVVTQGVVVTASDVFVMHGRLDEAVLVVSNFIFIVAAGGVAVFLSRRRLTAQRQLQIQTWHLQQLLPTPGKWDTQPASRRSEPLLTAPRTGAK